MRKLSLAGLFLFCLIEVPKAQHLSSQIEKAEFLLQQHQVQTNTPGVQVAVLKNGELIWSEAFGYADIEHSKALQTSTPMRVASVSKPMTSMVLGKLVEDGVLDLDEDIRTYVPEYPDKGATITARHLAASTSGIRHYTAEDPEYNHIHYSSVIDALAPFKNDALLFEPGTDYHYSSYGWVLLSVVMERASGVPFQKLMQSNWADLGMHNTYLDHPDFHPEEISTQYIREKEGFLKQLFSRNDTERIAAPKENRSFMYAGGGYLSTAEDLVKMGWKLISGENLNNSTVEMLFQDQKLENGTRTQYGLGWEVGISRTGTAVVFHSGGMSSARSHLVIYPEENLVLAILMNTGDHVFFNEREAQTIAELFLNKNEEVDTIKKASSITGRWNITTTSLRDKRTKGEITLYVDSTQTIKGTFSFKRSRKKKTFPIVLAGIKDDEYHFVGVSPMYFDLYVTFAGNSISGTWLHDFNIKGEPEIDPYWKPRVIQGVRISN